MCIRDRLMRSLEMWLGRRHEIGWLMRSLEMWLRRRYEIRWLMRSPMSHFGQFGELLSTL